MYSKNPYLPLSEYIPDGEPHVFNDRLYVYGSHDCFNGQAFCMNDYVAWSCPVTDLSDWRCEGVIYSRLQDPQNADGTHYMYAPDVTQGPDGRYYLYYGLDLFFGTLSVAVCDEPAGKFEFLSLIHYADGTPVGKRDGDCFQYDPAVFVDDDGRIFLYSGFCPPDALWKFRKIEKGRSEGALVMELEPDMHTVKRGPELLISKDGTGTSFEGHAFFEASSIRKYHGIYYFLYSSEHQHELCYATSSLPDRDFTYGGVVVSNGDIGYHGRTKEQALNYTATNHGSIIKVLDDYYVFYHRQTNATMYSRQGCAEKIALLPDGSIPQVEITSMGLCAQPLPASGSYPASLACNLYSKEGACQYVVRVPLSDAHPYFSQESDDLPLEDLSVPYEQYDSQYIKNIKDGSVAGYKYFDFKAFRAFSLTCRGEASGSFLVGTAPGLSDICKVSVNSSADWQTVTVPATSPAGIHPLYIQYSGSGIVDLMTLTFA